MEDKYTGCNMHSEVCSNIEFIKHGIELINKSIFGNELDGKKSLFECIRNIEQIIEQIKHEMSSNKKEFDDLYQEFNALKLDYEKFKQYIQTKTYVFDKILPYIISIISVSIAVLSYFGK